MNTEQLQQAQFEQYIELLILYKVHNLKKNVYISEKSLKEAIQWYTNYVPEYIQGK